MSQTLLCARDLAVGYDGRAVVRQIDLAAEAGQLLCLLGPNGAGKTTLLRTLAGLLRPIGGQVLLDGRDLARMDEKTLARELAVVLTDRPTPERMSCEELVSLGRSPYTGRLGLLSAQDREKTREALALVGTEELAERDFERISDGQRQRVLLARALCQEPRVLLLDEPSSFLDLKHKLDFLTLLRRLSRERSLAVILSLHELSLARHFSDRVLCLKDGRVDRQGSPEEIFTAAYMEALFSLSPGSAAFFL